VEIILLKQVKSLGEPGETKKVKRGYAVNFLIPGGFALPATPGFIKEAQSRVRKLVKAKEIELKELKSVIDEISKLELTVSKKAGKEGKLFGSIKEKDIVKLIAEKIGRKIEEKCVVLDKPIKEIGDYEIEIMANDDVKTKIKLKIEAE